MQRFGKRRGYRVMMQADLKRVAEDSSKKIANAIPDLQYFEFPFQHIVIDNFFGIPLAESCLENFPNLDEDVWEFANDNDIEIKYRTNWQSEFDIPNGIIDVVRILNSSLVLKAIGNILNIPKLMPDPYYAGGGLNVTKQGGLLDIHVDGNYHDASGMHRRVNVLLYLNKNWQESWGGEFGIYDQSGNICIKKVSPIFNRLVIFDTHDKSYHGLPNPISCPKDQLRRSIILYYYTKDPRPSDYVVVGEPHSALWKKRGYLDKRGNKTRKFE
jgi:hypothetical protein